jgi:energy-coupling factor transport system ATP-binding protein
MEWLGLTPDVMRRRVEESLDLLGLADVRRRPMSTLSGGQQQRVAIGAAMTSHPRVLVLDEPTSALDPQAAEDVLSALQRLVHDLGTTSCWPSSLEQVVSTRTVCCTFLATGGRRRLPDQIMAAAPIVPPVVGSVGSPAGGRCRCRSPMHVPGRRQPARRVEPPDPAAGRGSAADRSSPLAGTLTVRYGGQWLRGIDRRPAQRDRRPDGPQRCGQVSLLTAMVGLVEPSDGTIFLGGCGRTGTPSRWCEPPGWSRREPADSLRRVGGGRVP